jgi:hypothetical protein
VVTRTFEGVSVPSVGERGIEVERFEAASGSERDVLRPELIGPPRSVVESGKEAEGRYEVTCSAVGRSHGTYLVGVWRPDETWLDE